MKNIIRKFFFIIIYPIIQFLGISRLISVAFSDKDFLLNNLIGMLRNINFNPQLIVDVGANHGTWTRIWKKAFPGSNFLLVEPQDWLKPKFADLLDEKTIYVPGGAGKENGIFKFTIDNERDDSSTFALTDNEAQIKGFSQIDVPVYTINYLVNKFFQRHPDIIKIDAEGLDIDVLEGSSDFFGKTEIFFVEASVNAHFKHTSIEKSIQYMDEKGYKVFDFSDLNRPYQSNVLWLVEIVFIRKGGKLDQTAWEKI